MDNESIIRAWKDTEYRKSLTPEQQGILPEHPAGLLDLTDIEQENIAGGTDWNGCTQDFFCGLSIVGSCGVNTWGCCPPSDTCP